MFSPFQEEHDQFRSMVRAFVEREIRLATSREPAGPAAGDRVE